MKNHFEGVILAGGQGTRIQDLTKKYINKPLIEIGKIPIIFHVAMRYLKSNVYNINILSGWNANKFEKQFWEDLNKIRRYNYLNTFFKYAKFNIINSGEFSDTFERLGFLDHTKTEKFIITYGDTITDLDLNKSIKNYNKKRLKYQISATRPSSNFGVIKINKLGFVSDFNEKMKVMPYWVSCGFFITPADIFKLFPKAKNLEKEVLPQIAKNGDLGVYKHRGLWLPIDTKFDYTTISEKMRNYNINDIDNLPPWL